MKTVLFINLMRAIVMFAYQRSKIEMYALMQNMLVSYWMSFAPTQIEMGFRESISPGIPQDEQIWMTF